MAPHDDFSHELGEANRLPDYLLAAIAEFDEAPETECASAFERMKDALGRAIVEAEG